MDRRPLPQLLSAFVTQARNPAATEATRRQIGDLQRLGWYHSIELPDGSVIQGLQSIDLLRSRLAHFPIPEDLTGKRVLDIGAWDGWFSFEMERRGAQVVAVDSTRHTRFLTARELLGSRVDYHIAEVCHLSPRDIGYFDIVLFFGVLYHLKHPLLGLEKVCELTSDLACVESYVTDDGTAAIPLMEFYETTELRGQFDNWVGPNVACLLAFCRTAGFAMVSLESVVGERAHVTCRRRWPALALSGPGPYVTCVENSVSCDHTFSTAADDYVAIWFKSGCGDLSCDDVCAEIGGFACRPVHVHATGGDGWHLNCKLPPGLRKGWHDVRLRIGTSEFGNSVRIGVDLTDEERQARRSEPAAANVRIELVTDGRSWERSRVRVGPGSCVSLWVSGIPEGAGRNDIAVRLNGADLPAIFLSEPDKQGLRQVNALLPSGLHPGDASIALRYRQTESPAVGILLVGG
jgi:tRNA (mo5U34)-methyltransferase